jgi:hypothetical protein
MSVIASGALGAPGAAPEDGSRGDRLGDEAQQADEEKPQTKVPHTIGDRPQRVAP